MSDTNDATQTLWAEYVDSVRRTSGQLTGRNEREVAGTLGLCGEVAEVAEEVEATADPALQTVAAGAMRKAGKVSDTVKKIVFHASDHLRAKLVEEIGDVFWYLALLMDALGISLEEVLRANIAKLIKRYPKGFDAARSINRDE